MDTAMDKNSLTKCWQYPASLRKLFNSLRLVEARMCETVHSNPEFGRFPSFETSVSGTTPGDVAAHLPGFSLNLAPCTHQKPCRSHTKWSLGDVFLLCRLQHCGGLWALHRADEGSTCCLSSWCK